MPVRSPAAILFVDDNAHVREVTSEILRLAGFDVWEAITGGEALRLVGNLPDLVILDVCLPDVSGFEVCRRIRADPETASIPVLHLSGEAVGSADRAHGLEGGADGYLLKPVEPPELIAHVRALLRLRQAESSLATLSRQLLRAQEAERRHIAHELHDDVGQALTALKITLHTLQQTTPAAAPASLLQKALDDVDRIMHRVRTLSLELRPPMMDDLGLVPALRWHVKEVAQRTGLQVQLEGDAYAGGLSAEVEMACFRVVQEVLNNVIKHARARSAIVELEPANDELHLVVTDDGAGFDVAAARKRNIQGASMGLLGIEERVRLLGGRLIIRSAMGEGTEVRARFPLAPPAPRESDS